MSDILHSATRSFGSPMLFSVLPEDVRDELRTNAPSRHFSDGQIIQQRGDNPEGFWLIESGSVAVGRFLRDGEFRGVALLGPGDSWGELAMFTSRPRVVDAIARSPTEVRHIGGARFEAVLSDNPSAMRSLLSALSQQLQEVLDVVAGIRRGSAPARVAGILATLSEGDPLDARVAISQQELGELLGLTRATVNAALRDFEHAGLLRRLYGAVEVLDREGLSQAAMD